MQRDIKKYKVVRRGPKYCVRVQGVVDIGEVQMWCYERNIKGRSKVNHGAGYTWEDMLRYKQRWDYDFIFDKPTEATAFIIGYL